MDRQNLPGLPLASLLLLALPGGAEMPPIGIIDFYGLRGGVSESEARQALPFKEGDPAPVSLEDAERRLEALPGVVRAAIVSVCCEAERGIVYVGIEERGAPVLQFRSPPRGTIVLPVEIREAGSALDQAWFEAVQRGDVGEDHAQGHALADDAKVRALQEKLLPLAARNAALLHEVLHDSAAAEDRALAAQILGYAPNKSEVVEDLVFGMRDPAAGVRNDSMRALWTITALAKRSPQLGIRVPAEPFVEMLDSVVWSDRNKASAALFELSEARDPALLANLRERALPSLVEMARFQSPGHALAPFVLLGRVVGLSEEEIQAAWSRPDREAAVEALRKRAGMTLAGHEIVVDKDGRLLSWVQPQEAAYGRVVRLAWEELLTGFPVEDNGLPTWLTYCCFDAQTLRGGAWPHNPASVYAGLAQGAAAYHAYSGDRRVIDLVRRALDYQLAQGTTSSDPWWAWPSVPYASADHGAIRYRGAHDFRYADANDPVPRLGRGDGYGVIEPDKLGELGLGYLIAWKLTSDPRYREAALACARALARHVRAGDAEKSPWPFRVVAETGFVREEYCANVGPAIQLFDELTALGMGEVDEWRRARRTAFDWLVAYPLKNDVWANYFEDVPWLPRPTNLNQYAAGELARYVLEHPDRDPEWREHAAHLLAWMERTFGVDTPREKGVQWGAVTLSEQTEYMYKMGSHTSRFASVLALWHERTGDPAAREKAFRSFNWASYMCDGRGVVRVGPVEASLWFSDGYGDYIRHFMTGLGAVPEWAPPGEDHLLRSSSVVVEVGYEPGRVQYRSFDDVGEEVLRLSFVPKSVTAEGMALGQGATGPGFAFDPRTRVLRVRRAGARTVAISGDPSKAWKRKAPLP